MWKVLPNFALIKLLFFVFSTLLLSAIFFFLDGRSGNQLSWSDFVDSTKLVTPITILFFVIIFFIGKKGWMLFWKLPVLGKLLNINVCPNLNGRWVGEIYSSFSKDGELNIVKEVELTAKADFFGFDLSLRSLDGYQDSKVIQSELYRDSRSNTFYLYYIFEASVLIPEEEDDRTFEGAAKLEVVIDKSGALLKGNYWTNRAWQRGKNTAGKIMMRRVD